jgi:hypothetical protein
MLELMIFLPDSVRHVPDWFPGTNFKQIAAHWSRLYLDASEGPYYWAKAHQA